jgi:hypothetical protein
MRLRLALAALVACAAAIAAGCGGTTSKSGVSGEAGASLVRSGALAYLAVDSDLSSSQWGKVKDLLNKFPGHDKWIRRLEQSLAQQEPSIDYDRDLKDALGPEVDFAVAAPPQGKPVFAVLTKPDSMDEARELVKKENTSGSGHAVLREVDGWAVVGESDAAIDQVLKASGDQSLADDAPFEDAMAALPADALAKAYINGKRLGSFVGGLVGGAAQTAAVGPNPLAPLGLDKLDWIGAAVDAKDDGIRFQGGANASGSGQPLNTPAPYASTLISGVPADALAFMTFRGESVHDQFTQLQNNPQFGSAFAQIEKALGMRLEPLLALFGHEAAFYVRRGPGLPEFSLVLEEPDTQAALATIDRLANRVAEEAHTHVYAEQQDGLRVKSIGLSRVTVHWAGFDGRVLLTTSPTGIADYRAGGDKLPDASAYKDVLAAAGAPDKTSGLVYADLHDGLQLLLNYAGASGTKVPPDVQANLKPLRSFVAYGTADGDLAKFSAFLQIK